MRGRSNKSQRRRFRAFAWAWSDRSSGRHRPQIAVASGFRGVRSSHRVLYDRGRLLLLGPPCTAATEQTQQTDAKGSNSRRWTRWLHGHPCLDEVHSARLASDPGSVPAARSARSHLAPVPRDHRMATITPGPSRANLELFLRITQGRLSMGKPDNRTLFPWRHGV